VDSSGLGAEYHCRYEKKLFSFWVDGEALGGYVQLGFIRKVS
jgi:hypothetical protein